jgi:hypothetical protein
MPDNQLFEAVANLILQSISVWEDMHMYAVAYSAEYNAFWELLDDNLKSSVYRYRKQNREERLVPYSMSLVGYYKVLVTKDCFDRIGSQYWKKQLKSILSDQKFRALLTRLNFELEDGRKGRRRNLDYQTAANPNSPVFATRVG